MLRDILNFAAHIPLAQASEQVVERSLTFHPPVSGLPTGVWYAILVGFFVIAGGASIYLYRAQRRIASRKVVGILTTLRVLLILLMVLMLAGIGRQFTYHHNSGGTLWIMVDQSGSMGHTDSQATDWERLRWADALGYLPSDQHASDLARQSAQAQSLRDDLNHLQAVAAAPVEQGNARQRVDSLIKNLKQANQRLLNVIEAVEKDPRGKTSAASTTASLRQAASALDKGVEKAQGHSKPEEILADIPWAAVQTALAPAVDALSDLSIQADKEWIRQNDPKVNEAIDRVSKLTRAKLAELALAGISKSDRTAVAFHKLMARQGMKVVGFGEQAQIILPQRQDGGDRQAISAALSKPDAPATDIASGLQLISDQVGQAEPASVVIVSDGRQNKKSGEVADAARRLAGRGIRVYSLAVGSRKIAPDAAVENIDSPDWVFKGDTLKLSALLRFDGLYKEDESGGYIGPKRTVDVELHRTRVLNGKAEDLVIASKPVDMDIPPRGALNQVRKVVAFSERKEALPDPGLYDYRVQIKELPDEAVKQNNSQTVRVSVKDHKLAALIIEDQPRYEYRYLASYLQRDQRVKLQTVLLQAARIEKVQAPTPVKASPDNKKTEAQILPQTQEEWYQFDLIVLGDLPPEALSREQQTMIVKAVANRGSTVILIAGALNMPGNWGSDKSQNPLCELFPVETSPEWTPQLLQQHLRGGYRPEIAPDGRDSLLTQFGIDPQANAAAWAEIQSKLGDPLSSMNWYWHSDFTQAKGGAQVIWEIEDNAQKAPGAADSQSVEARITSELEAAHRRALLATMNIGLGKVMYLAGDQTWRMRQVNGLNLHERFWGQVVRWVVGNDLPAGGQLVRFGTDKPRYVDGEAAMVTARVSDKHLTPLSAQKIKVVAQALDVSGAARPNTRVEAEMIETPGSPGQYRAFLQNLPAGRVELSLEGSTVSQLMSEDPTATQKTLTVEVRKDQNLEQQNINTDRPALASIAHAGDGSELDAEHADVLAEHIPELNRNISTIEQIGLFADPKDSWTRYSHWIFLGLFVGLITAEWIVRKAGGLV